MMTNLVTDKLGHVDFKISEWIGSMQIVIVKALQRSINRTNQSTLIKSERRNAALEMCA